MSDTNKNAGGQPGRKPGQYSPSRLAGSGGTRPPSSSARQAPQSGRPPSSYRPSASQGGRSTGPGSGSTRPPSAPPGRSYASQRPAPPPSRIREPEPEPPKQKPRRKKKSWGALGALLYVIVVIGASGLLAGIGWIAACDVLALDKESHEAVVVVKERDSIDDVAKILEENGLIEYKLLFQLFASFTHANDKVTAGTYELNTDMDYRAIISSMSKNSSARAVTTVTITEGMTVSQVFHLLEEKGVSTEAKLEDTAANHPFKFSFLQDIPLGKPTRLEGYLFPDTYQFYLGGDPVDILNKMILRFDEKFTQDMRDKAAAEGYSVHDIVTIASMIEKETDGEDQPIISSVIYNRLNRPSRETAGYLNIDATIAYVTGRKVTTADYSEVVDPYNTYLNQGLPPGPIANPGMVSIHAALNPDSTKYYFYALGDDGAHHFFQTKKGHTDFIASQELYQNAEE